jgi:hypothetical protein
MVSRTTKSENESSSTQRIEVVNTSAHLHRSSVNESNTLVLLQWCVLTPFWAKMFRKVVDFNIWFPFGNTYWHLRTVRNSEQFVDNWQWVFFLMSTLRGGFRWDFGVAASVVCGCGFVVGRMADDTHPKRAEHPTRWPEGCKGGRRPRMLWCHSTIRYKVRSKIGLQG